MNPKIKEILTELSNTHYGAALREYLNFKYSEINDILKATPDDVQGRQIALKLLNEVFAFLGDNSAITGRTKKQYT